MPGRTQVRCLVRVHIPRRRHDRAPLDAGSRRTADTDGSRGTPSASRTSFISCINRSLHKVQKQGKERKREGEKERERQTVECNQHVHK